MIILADMFEHFKDRVIEHRGEFGVELVINTQKTKQIEKQKYYAIKESSLGSSIILRL